MASAADSVLEEPGRIGIATGWGLLRPIRISDGRLTDFFSNEPVRPGDQRYFSDRLMQVELPLVSQDACRSVYAASIARGAVLDSRVFCAGVAAGGRDTCQGDSGGPLLTRTEDGRYVQIGVISWGKMCGMPDGYGINTRVSAFANWIEEKMGIQRPQPAPTPVAPVTPDAPTPAISADIAAGDRALLVGVDTYKNARFNLRGNVNDVSNMRRLLIETYGFKPEQILTLTDAEATRTNILAAFDQWLVRGSIPGSRVYFFFSGHGFQEPDQDGDESDGKDETIVPYDAVMEAKGNLNFVRNQIIDDEIRERLKNIPDRKITVVIDACFSGTITRGDGLTPAGELAPFHQVTRGIHR